MKRSLVAYPTDNKEIAILHCGGYGDSDVIIDRGNAEVLSMVVWSKTKPDSGGRQYVRRLIKTNGKIKVIHLHRVISCATNGFVVDHINGNGLDNRVGNLRICTQSVNLHNRTRFKKNKVGTYLGTYYDKRKKRWRAEIVVGGRRFHTKRFRTEYEAHVAYQKKKRELLGADFIR